MDLGHGVLAGRAESLESSSGCASGVRDLEELGDLVVGVSDALVKGCGEDAEGGAGGSEKEESVAARDEECEEGESWERIDGRCEERCERVRLLSVIREDSSMYGNYETCATYSELEDFVERVVMGHIAGPTVLQNEYSSTKTMQLTAELPSSLLKGNKRAFSRDDGEERIAHHMMHTNERLVNSCRESARSVAAYTEAPRDAWTP